MNKGYGDRWTGDCEDKGMKGYRIEGKGDKEKDGWGMGDREI